MEKRLSATFSHDGIHDSLTQLAAPPYFYEELQRGISAALRSSNELTVIRIVLAPPDSTYEEVIIKFAETLNKNFRSEDLCARLGEGEFAMIVAGGQELARNMTERLISMWRSEYSHAVVPAFAMATHDGNQSALELLNHLDREELSTGKGI